jgi:ADP-ribose pyrophosphatase YjhB (NUDIX family)
MRLTRSATVPAPAAGQDEATHVLAWVPGWLSSTGHGSWVLQEAAAYEAGVPGAGCPETDDPRDAGPEDLALWVTAVLGYRVVLDRAWATLASLTFRPPSVNAGREPVYFVTPAEFTDISVLTTGVADGWADPEEDPALIDWPPRQGRAVIWFDVDGGRPVSPAGHATTVRRGRNRLGRWGENPAADAIVTATCAGVRHLLMVDRDDDNGWAVPGGMAEPGENGVVTALRELAEETGLVIEDPALCRRLPARIVPDPRASDEAWAVTWPVLVDLGDVDELPAVAGADDARRAAWIPARDYECLSRALLLDHDGGQVFPAHVAMLADVLSAS